MEDAVLTALLVIEHDRYRDPRVPGPTRVGRVTAVTYEVAWIGIRGIQLAPPWLRVATIQSRYANNASLTGRGFQPVSRQIREIS
jgi:hypothetical protein